MRRLLRARRQTPIAFKLLALVVLVTSMSALAAVAVSLYVSYRDDLADLDRRLDQVRISTLPSITNSLWSFDEEQLNVQVQSLLDVEDVIQVTVIWRDWNDKDRALHASVLDTDNPNIDENVGKLLTKEFSLNYSDPNTAEQNLGTLYLTASLNAVHQKLWQRAQAVVALQGTQTLVIAILLLWFIRTLLTRHMESIAQHARQLTLTNLESPLELDRRSADGRKPDELDNIVDAFNQMRQSLLDDLETKRVMEEQLTAEKQEKLETVRQKTVAEAANRAKSQFLATMSHEIRTPMNGVIGMVELLRDTPLNDNQRHYLDVIYRSGTSLLDIINDVLDYSKIEAGKLELEQTTFNLENLLDDCIQLFGATANQKNVELVGNLHPHTPKFLQGDPTRLRQILINLLGNAFKFTETGIIVLTCRVAEELPEGRQKLLFSVSDTGIGINQSKIDHLFDSFSQEDNSTTRRFGGTGLGLAISKQLAQMMGGEIGVQNNQDVGSTFWFTASLREADMPAEVVAAEHVFETLKGKRLLIVEDNTALAEVFSLHAESWNLSADTDHFGELAVGHYQESLRSGKPYDFIALDYHLPDKDGLVVAKQIKETALAAGREPPAMFLFTGSDHAFTKETLTACGVSDLLRKPLLPKRLRIKLVELTNTALPLEMTEPVLDELKGVDLSHLKVLVAEDNAVNRMVIKGMLNKLKVQPILVGNGKEALTAVIEADRRYDLVLMDCEMPEMDGFDATRNIRQYEQTQGLDATLIVALTAHALEEHREQVFACGMNYYLSKPLTFPRLIEMAESLGLMASAKRLLARNGP